MPFDFRNAFVSDALPEDRSLLLVDGVDLPCVLRIVFDRCDVAVKPETRFVLSGADGRRHENLVAPNYWTRMGQSRNRRLPTDVLLSRRVELNRLRRALDHAGRARSTELRPVLCMSHQLKDRQKREGK